VFSISRTGDVLLRVPRWVTDRDAQRLIDNNQDKLNALVEKWERAQAAKPVYRDEDIPQLKQLAVEQLPDRVKYWADQMKLIPSAVKITSAQARFGSCNSRGSICFSCFLMLYPDDAIDAVIVHELAHLKHMDHSADFYRLVEQYLPDYRTREAFLKGRTL
jgi:predicted metal-dependent hydrolase